MESLPEPDAGSGPVTRLLARMSRGDREAVHDLWPLVYEELKSLAAGFLRHEAPDPLLQPTVIVHEAFLRLVGQDRVDWKDRRHFYRVAAQAMRRILVDWARRRRRRKHGGGMQQVPLDDTVAASSPAWVVDLDEALDHLGAANSRWAEVVQMRFFAGMTIPEVAAALGVAERTVERDWQFARAWLHRRMTV